LIDWLGDEQSRRPLSVQALSKWVVVVIEVGGKG
jgi:hypothetical protein